MKMDQEEEEEMQEKEVVKNQKNNHHAKMVMLQRQSNCNVVVSSSWDESLGIDTSGDDFEEEEEEEEGEVEEEEISCSESSGPPAVPASSENSCSVSNEEVVDYCYGPALKRNVRAWCEATGLPTTVIIRVKDRAFHLHKFPLISRSGFLSRLLKDAKDVTLPNECPGGPEIFELVANFCYGSTILMEPSNVAELCCVAEYLQMSEEYGRANLSERSNLYLTQVSLQSWEDTLIVLQHCECLLPLADDLQIITRCIESLALVACMELLDPAERKARHSMSGESRFWNISDVVTTTTITKNNTNNTSINTTTTNNNYNSHRDSSCTSSTVSGDWWIQDLVALPPNLFVRLIVAIRRQGMEESYVGQVITRFAERWIFGTDVGGVLGKINGGRDDDDDDQNHQESSWSSMDCGVQVKPNLCMLVEAVVRLLPLERDVVPISFLFALLRCGLASGLLDDCRLQLESWIALQLEQATLDDVLLPSKKEKDSGSVLRTELKSMERIVKLFVSRHRGFIDTRTNSMVEEEAAPPGFSQCIQSLSTVAKLWDEYLAEIAFDSTLIPAEFADLVERVPEYSRLTHDHVYRAIDFYLKDHPNTTQEERLIVCQSLNCQKLSQKVCTHAVQNNLIPLRTMVQAMFVQQMHTRTALTSHLELASGGHHQSFRSDTTASDPCNNNFDTFSRSVLIPKCTPGVNSVPNSGPLNSGPLHHHHNSGPLHLHCSDFVLPNHHQDSFQSTQELHEEFSYPEAIINPQTKLNVQDANYQATESRLQSLEAELSQMRKVLSKSIMAESKVRGGGGRYNNSESRQSYRNLNHSGQLRQAAAATRKEGGIGSGCMSQLKPANRTSGLVARTLQKLGFRSSGSVVNRKPKNPSPERSNFEVPDHHQYPARVDRSDHAAYNSGSVNPWWQGHDGGGTRKLQEAIIARTDSMPRNVTTSSRVHQQHHHHVRHNSMT